MAELLPEELLEDVLRRVPPRSLAASRCVCKAWRGLIDAGRLLRADLLPLTLGGLFIEFQDLPLSEFFRPSAMAAVSGDLSYADRSAVGGHCNGLVLLDDATVVNPATRRWALVPPPPPPPSYCAGMEDLYDLGNRFLAFDPSVSPHYEVFLVPCVPFEDELGLLSKESEWPPSPLVLQVYSSGTERWEERSFLREGDAAGTVADMLEAWRGLTRHGVYLHGQLYVQIQNDCICRISLSSGKYRVINPPRGFETSRYPEFYLGKSGNKVHCALVDSAYGFRVWTLDESCQWVLKRRVDLRRALTRGRYRRQVADEPWILEDVNYFDQDDGEAPLIQMEESNPCYVHFLGFHPSRDVVFLSDTLTRGIAYHLKSSRVEYLGHLCPKHYRAIAGHVAQINASFPYTPCWIGDLSENNQFKGSTDGVFMFKSTYVMSSIFL